VTIGEPFAEVLAKAKAGDRAAFETIYRDVAPLVIGYLRANRVNDAEDLAGEVFVTMVQRIDRFDGDEHHFRSWLLTICHRRMVDAVRRAQRRPEELLPTEELGKRLNDDPSGEVEAMEHLDAMGIVELMDDLSELQREALSLRVLADLSIRDVARIMDKPETAVKALLRRAPASLARVMEAS
jgi:RNA polymerase sigma-70 factor (ECF subfamily)